MAAFSESANFNVSGSFLINCDRFFGKLIAKNLQNCKLVPIYDSVSVSVWYLCWICAEFVIDWIINRNAVECSFGAHRISSTAEITAEFDKLPDHQSNVSEITNQLIKFPRYLLRFPEWNGEIESRKRLREHRFARHWRLRATPSVMDDRNYL